MSVGEILTVKVNSMAPEGDGVARAEGSSRVLFIPHPRGSLIPSFSPCRFFLPLSALEKAAEEADARQREAVRQATEPLDMLIEEVREGKQLPRAFCWRC